MKKYSKQRELILLNLKSRTDHPTVEMLFYDLKKQMPTIGIATIYRNLVELNKNGEIIKISQADGADRYDGNVTNHFHLKCTDCKKIVDIMLTETESSEFNLSIHKFANKFSNSIDKTEIIFSGKCKNC